MRIKLKRLNENAIVPKYAHYGDAAVDLYASSKYEDEFGNVCYGTGFALEVPEGYVGLLFARSSISKINLRLANAVGVIDSGYRGEIVIKFDKNGQKAYDVGDRVAQFMILPLPPIQFVEVGELSKTVRGVGGFGSSGN